MYVNTHTKWKNTNLVELSVQNCVSNLILDKRCSSYHLAWLIPPPLQRERGGWASTYLPATGWSSH